MARKHRETRKQSTYSQKANGQKEYTFKEPKNIHQEYYLNLIEDNDIVICNGAPGCGKTLLALQKGIEYLRDDRVDKIYYLRNNIDYKALGSQGIGFTSGDFIASEKAKPLMMPVFTNLPQLVSEEKARVLIGKEKIQPLILDMIQGMTFFYNYVIVDEAENIPPAGMRMILTRLGKGSKIIVIGDSQQKCTKSSYDDGLMVAMQALRGLKKCGIMAFKSEHSAARHGLIPEINKRFDKFGV